MTRIEDRERVLFLYLPTGGGHLSNCKAISRRVAERYGAETLAYDPVSARSPFGKLFLEGGYRFMSLRLPWLWNLLFELNDKPDPSLNYIEALQRLISAGELARDWAAKAGITDTPIAKQLQPFPDKYEEQSNADHP